MMASVQHGARAPMAARFGCTLLLLAMLAACAEHRPVENPCALADRPVSLGVLAENSARKVYALCLEQRMDAIVEALSK